MSKKMNFLFIGVDQLRFDTLGVNGNDICDTPNIDKLANEGYNFSRAYSTCPLCSPARASMFTGKYAFKHGMGTNCDMYHSLSTELNEPEMLLHNKLLDKDYKCGYVGKWHVGTKLGPCDYGFEGMNVPGYGNCRFEKDFLDYLDSNQYSYSIEKPIHYNPNNKTLSAGIWNGSEESTTEYFLANKTIDLIDKFTKNNDSFFLTCQFWGPHGPHFPPKSFVGKSDRSKIKPWINFEDDLEGKPGFVKRHLRDFYRNPPKNWDEWREVIGFYYDFMSFIDKQIGRILDYLDDIGEKDNTIIFLTSDHGDMKSVHGGLIDKGFLYEEAMHIPFIMYHPEYSGLKNRNEFIYNMDIMPTILDVIGENISNLDGRSLLPLLENNYEWNRRNAYLEFHGIRFLYSQRAVVNENNYKYIWTPGDFDELYDLNKDPGELNNLINDDEYTKIKDGLVEQLKENAVKYEDPLQDYVYKILGEWSNPSGQVDTTAQKI
ncbi:sulfatase-like hydrolase/transferase [Clostridium sediminicola]|uniref:sulfatase-like hydrolase/transferase n=1 Tax=Clostridium sediminicola TaxID=3114879 RepID=UPI0031F225A0